METEKEKEKEREKEKRKSGLGAYVEQFFSKSYLFLPSPQYLKLLCIHYQQHVK